MCTDFKYAMYFNTANVLKCLNQILKYFWFTMYHLVNYNVALFAILLRDKHIVLVGSLKNIFQNVYFI